MKNRLKFIAPILCTSLLFACSNADNSNKEEKTDTENSSTSQEVADAISKAVSYQDEDFYSDWESENPTSIQLNGDSANYEGSGGVMITDNTITIKSSGVYSLSGKLDDGQIIVDTDSKDKGLVRLILNGADINSSTNAAIFVKNAEKTVVSLQEGTENYLSDAKEYVYEDAEEDEPNGALFSKDDLTINGAGSLVVKGNYNNGIVGKDDLKITDGNIEIEAVDDAIVGRDVLAVKDGTINIQAGGDGLKSTNDKDATKGTIAIEGGNFEITSTSDGIQAETSIFIADGDFKINSGGGSPEMVARKEGPGMMPGLDKPAADETRMPPGQGDPETDETRMLPSQDNTVTADSANASTANNKNTTSTETESTSAKAMKAAVEVAIGGGSFSIDSSDDAVHSNNRVTISNGELDIATGDDAIHADSSVLIKGGNINITKSYEGIESKVITIEDGNIHVTSSDDGINVGGGNDGSGRDMQTESEGSKLIINGGYVVVNAEGDGLDSNGSIAMTDGIVLVSGPTNNGNGALDYDQGFKISGGILVAAGSAGMAQATSDDSAQNSIAMTFPETQAAATLVHLEDNEGNTIVTFAPEKDYQSVVISSPKLKKDNSYILYSGGKTTGNEENGLYTDGKYQNGSKIVEFTISESVTWLDESGVTTPKTGGPGGQGIPSGEGGGPNGQGGQGPEGRGNPGDMFGNLDEETRVKVQEIMEKERAGTITREEAQEQISELGIEFPREREKR